MNTKNVEKQTTNESSLNKRPCRTKKQKKFFDESVPYAAKSKKNKTVKQTLNTTKKDGSNLISKKLANDDEAVWLDALEKGQLDENGCLPKSRDVLQLTARQKNKLMFSSHPQNFLKEIEIKEELSEDARRKKEEKNRRRRIQAIAKAEENKRQTIEKLVKVVSGSHQKSGKKSVEKIRAPMIRYFSDAVKTILVYPEGFDFPLRRETSREPPQIRMCEVCNVNRRKYDCSKSHTALCSLECYRKNLSSI